MKERKKDKMCHFECTFVVIKNELREVISEKHK